MKFKMPGSTWLKCWVVGFFFLNGLMAMGALQVRDLFTVTLAWAPSLDSRVTGYKIYYGTTSHGYTNVVTAGNVTTISISGFQPGTTGYFAATAYDASGVESDFSNEASYQFPSTITTSAPVVSFGNQFSFTVSGVPGTQCVIQASTNLVNWVAVQTNTVPFTLVDTNASSFGQRFFRAIPWSILSI